MPCYFEVCMAQGEAWRCQYASWHVWSETPPCPTRTLEWEGIKIQIYVIWMPFHTEAGVGKRSKHFSDDCICDK